MDNIKSVLVSDSNGSLTKDIAKIYVDKPVISATLSDAVESKRRTLKISLTNTRFDSLPNLVNCTYKVFLAYNGTGGYSNKVFSSVVSEYSGIFDKNNLPDINYDPSGVTQPDSLEELSDTVIDIKMYNGQVDVLQYSEGVLSGGEKQYFVSSRRSYPTQITALPNVSGNKVHMDGWYSYTGIIFRDIDYGDTVIKDSFYAYRGLIFKASDSGTMSFDDDSNVTIYIDENTSVLQAANEDYMEMMFSLNETTGTSAHANNLFVHSQILVTDEIRDSITREVVDAAFEETGSFADFQNWQKLTLKRLGAFIMFENGLYEKAQIILESARTFCTNGGSKYKTNCY